MVNEKVVEQVTRPLLVGAVGALASKFILGENRDVRLFNMVVPHGWLAIGAITAASSAVSVALKDFALPYIPENKQYANMEGMAVAPILNGVILYGVFAAGAPLRPDFFRTFGLGAGSEIAGGYAYDGFVQPYIRHNF